ncbi:hypothetical protein EXIGLDRAFT_117152 [Exidia glandulosa HHB12029]|uniref:Uncharacterized protein n=1 Tax=Exidia glandulosa HHB12029 TaxID=1314781 RepID=A0A165GHS7_EXIGL|nr:hypothetical protein EXIGLDRAFT_117152 [Exidia glandulosa HHB12029]
MSYSQPPPRLARLLHPRTLQPRFGFPRLGRTFTAPLASRAPISNPPYDWAALITSERSRAVPGCVTRGPEIACLSTAQRIPRDQQPRRAQFHLNRTHAHPLRYLRRALCDPFPIRELTAIRGNHRPAKSSLVAVTRQIRPD